MLCFYLLVSRGAVPRLSLLCTLTVIANLVQSGLVIWQSGVLRILGAHPWTPEVCDTHVTNLPVTVPAMSGIALIPRKFKHGIATLAFLKVLLLCLSHGLGDICLQHRYLGTCIIDLSLFEWSA